MVDAVKGGLDLAALATISEILDGKSPYDPEAFNASGHIYYTVMVLTDTTEPVFPGIFSTNVPETGMWLCTGSLDSWINITSKDYDNDFEVIVDIIRSALRNHGLHKLFPLK